MEHPISRNSLPGWTAVASWSLLLNLLLSGLLLALPAPLGLFLTGPMMILAAAFAMGGFVMARDSYRAGRKQGAVFGIVVNIALLLWPIQALGAWFLT